MQSPRRPMPPRHEFRVGTRELVIFGGAFVLIWALTFVFGVLVGRELPRSSPARAATGTAAAERSSDPTPPVAAEGREPVVVGKKVERGASEERLTFYRTLTAPTLDLPPTQPPHPPKVEERIVPHAAPAKPAPRPERRPQVTLAPTPAEAGQTVQAPAASAPAPPAAAGSEASVAPRPPTGSAATRTTGVASAPAMAAVPRPWTVQVSSFRSRALAEELRSQLQGKGFDAYLVRVATDEGRVWHRVRVGGYPTRAEAERIAGELRAERNLNPVVTSRTR
ncbi:MAG: SPOR domain-containing protein [Candidatus Rokubacteria bacterium]|nr:SPOR domain-containing protein [Candidatus Rokubacteria bacterium]